MSTTVASALPPVRVQLESRVGGPVHTVFSDDSGHFSFYGVPQADYVIVIDIPGYHTVNQPVEVGEASVVGLEVMLKLVDSRGTSGESSSNGSATVSVRQLRIPEKARKEFRKRIESQARGKTDEAIKHWEKSIQIYPQFAESYMELSKVYANRGDFAHATKAANRAVEIDGKDAAPYAYLGFVYLKAKKFAKAMEAFQNSVHFSDSLWFSQFWLGDLKPIRTSSAPRNSIPQCPESTSFSITT